MISDWGPQRFCPTCGLQLQERWDSKDDSCWWYCTECKTLSADAEVKIPSSTLKPSMTTEELVMNGKNNALKVWYNNHKDLWVEKEDVDDSHDRTWMSPDELYTMRKFVWLFKTYIKARCKLNTFTKKGIWTIWLKYLRDDRGILGEEEYSYWMEMFKWRTDAWTQVPVSVSELATITCEEEAYHGTF